MKHKSVTPLKSIPPIRRTFAAISIALSLGFVLAAFGANQGTSWTYQGQLRRSGAAYTGTCNFQFTLWDAASAGGQYGTTQAVNSVSVANGLFTVVLDFWDQFTGNALWLATSVQCGGDSGFTPLDPRQPITATPYALSLRPGAQVIGDNNITAFESTGQIGVKGITNWVTGSGVYGLGQTQDSVGVYGENGAGTAVKGNGVTGVYGVSNNAAGSGVFGFASGANAAGVFGQNSTGAGLWGKSTGTGSAVYGENIGTGYAGRFVGPVDVAGVVTVTGAASANGQLIATNTSSVGTGIKGVGPVGVYGTPNVSNGYGVFGQASLANSAGVFGSNRDSAAIWGQSTGVGSAIYGENTSTGYAGRFIGPVNIQGTLTKSAGTFQIDHPLDPANKFLSHSFVESPDMKNIYDGNVTTDATGSATVTMPAYFEALNRDFRYQLTVLGQFAQAIVSREIAGNSFEIHTDRPGVKVSWQVTGIRQDAYAQANPIKVEEFKPAEEKGKYLYPAGFGAGEEKRIGHLQGPAPAPDTQDSLGASQSGQARK